MDWIQKGLPIKVTFKKSFPTIHWRKIFRQGIPELWDSRVTFQERVAGRCLSRRLLGSCGVSKSLIQEGANPWRALKVISQIWKSILYSTGSQRGEARIGEICSCFFQVFLAVLQQMLHICMFACVCFCVVHVRYTRSGTELAGLTQRWLHRRPFRTRVWAVTALCDSFLLWSLHQPLMFFLYSGAHCFPSCPVT